MPPIANAVAGISSRSWSTLNAEKAGRRATDVNSKCMPSSLLREPHTSNGICLIGQLGDGLEGIDLVCLVIEGKGGTVIVEGAGFPGPSLLPHPFSEKCPTASGLDLPPSAPASSQTSQGVLVYEQSGKTLSIGGWIPLITERKVQDALTVIWPQAFSTIVQCPIKDARDDGRITEARSEGVLISNDDYRPIARQDRANHLQTQSRCLV